MPQHGRCERVWLGSLHIMSNVNFFCWPRKVDKEAVAQRLRQTALYASTTQIVTKCRA